MGRCGDFLVLVWFLSSMRLGCKVRLQGGRVRCGL